MCSTRSTTWRLTPIAVPEALERLLQHFHHASCRWRANYPSNVERSSMSHLTRRRFGALTSAALVSSLTRSLWAREVGALATSERFYVALVADSHIIDDFYVKGSENG